ncbi:TetR/AcrR family transcriptional regulator [Streptomyces sp. GMY02]|uniref:TetR/AcrR family transcriptional regulator n=1 Tax=Streptomyces sp. GMY02 TaxID=1333528 RepID=UPI001C2BD233|nr:TetR/AcrR family transcriptional regulator [Streptomyces sp. GMY02]QXE38428.1 TetR/AcrR family transcriptional regulator [Streptomyces sp. GMY02]
MPDTPRPLRRDAEANLTRILDVAVATFSEEGVDTSIEVVAQRAGVGLGTIYRRFANKNALLDELGRRLLANVVAIAEHHLEDPLGTGLAGYFQDIGKLLSTHSGLMARRWTMPDAEPVLQRSRELQGVLLADAQRHGLARPELTAEDVAVACWSLQGVVDTTRGLPVQAWQRHVEVLLAGFAPAGQRFIHAPLTAAEMDSVISSAPNDPTRPVKKQ